MKRKTARSKLFLKQIKTIVDKEQYNNIFITGRRPRQEISLYQVRYHDCLFNEKKDLMIPVKFKAYIAASQPVFSIIRGDTAIMIEEYDLGITADPADNNSNVKGFKKRSLYQISNYIIGENMRLNRLKSILTEQR